MTEPDRPNAERSKHRGERGAVLVETALVAGIILTFLLFSVQMGILGFLQITADASSFVAARVATLSTQDPGAYTARKFSQLKPSDVSSASPIPAPTSTVPVNYGYNDPTQDQAAVIRSRVGGYSELQPVLKQVTVTPSKVLKIAGLTGDINGTDTEPEWQECGTHFNVAGATNQCGDSKAPVNYQVDYFKNGENTPPYYIGFNEQQICITPPPWGNTDWKGASVDGECPAVSGGTGEGFSAIGVAERLDADNWTTMRTTAGALNNPSDAFWEAGCHQQYFAAMAAFFNEYQTLRALYTDNPQMAFMPVNTDSFTGWSKFKTADPVTGFSPDRDISTIYNWDATVVPGAPIGSDTTNPGLGCQAAP